jgi:hypothetical protein
MDLMSLEWVVYVFLFNHVNYKLQTAKYTTWILSNESIQRAAK